MIDYEKVKRGDILRLVGAGAPGFGVLGDLMRVLSRTTHGVLCENKHGNQCEFVYNCGAARLEPTEWINDFPGAKQPRADEGNGGEWVKGEYLYDTQAGEDAAYLAHHRATPG